MKLFSDDEAMRYALEWAWKAYNTTTPNPRVGCVLVKNQTVIGMGYTQPAGQNHAEIQALNDAISRGHDISGATAYITLEPCAHHGRTPPCTEALINAQIKRVVVGIQDPHPYVVGRGISDLRKAGVMVDCPVLEDEAYEINKGFFKRVKTGKPWVRVKMATSLDGRSALFNGNSQWITSEAARQDSHHYRARACAILTGVGTVLADNPFLTVRGVSGALNPLRIIVDSQLRTPASARVLQEWDKVTAQPGVISHNKQHVLMVHACSSNEKKAAWTRAGVDMLYLPEASGQVDLAQLIEVLGERGINEVHVEAGSVLSSALIQASCVDEILLYVSPDLLGSGMNWVNLPIITELAHRKQWNFHTIERIGRDVKIMVRFI